MNKTLSTLNQLARHSNAFTTAEFRDFYGGSEQSAANALSRAARQGLIERVARGRYVIREIGRLATYSSTEDLLLSLSPVLLDKEHRIAYLTALEYHSLLLHPQSEFQVALAAPTRTRKVSGRVFRQVIEVRRFLSVGAMEVDHGCRVSDLPRTLLDAARRPDLMGGVDIIGDALKLTDFDDLSLLVDYAGELETEGALRRLGSIAGAIGQSALAEELRSRLALPTTPIPVDPGADSSSHAWVDPEWNVTWDATSADLLGLPVRK